MPILINHEELVIESFYSHELKIYNIEALKKAPPKVYIEYIHNSESGQDNSTELLTLILLLEHFEKQRNTDVFVEFNYLPFSRMDKKETLLFATLEPFINLLNRYSVEYQFSTLHNSEPVFEILGETEENAKELYDAINFRDALLKSKKPAFFVAVDAGAKKRYSNMGVRFGFECEKVRSSDGTVILEHYVTRSVDTKPYTDLNETIHFILVDDICSKGTTFTNVAKELKRAYPNSQVHLFVQFMEREAYDAKLNKELFDENIVASIHFNTLI